MRSMVLADSLKIENQFAEEEKWEKIKASAQYPVFKAGEFSDVVPVPEAL